jgi:hypothetical protein
LEKGTFPVCAKEIQKRSLARHLRDQHPGVMPPRLDLEDIGLQVCHTRPRRYSLMAGRKGEAMSCPDGSCAFQGKTCTTMWVHFMHQHWRDALHFVGQPAYVKCTKCSMVVKSLVLDRHLASKVCRDGALRQLAQGQRSIVTKAATRPARFSDSQLGRRS